MSRRAEGQLFVGRLGKTARLRDLEEVFEPYGRILRCDIKYGAEMAYAFVDFEDRRDGEDALKYENGRDICGSSIVVEWAKGNPRRPLGYDECYRCHRPGHWARDCPEGRYSSPGRTGRGSRYRSPSPRRRKRSWTRSRSRSRRRSRSRDHRKRSRSRSRSRSFEKNRHSKHNRHTSSGSKSKRKLSQSRSRSRSASRSRSRSRRGSAKVNGDRDSSLAGSEGRSRSPSPSAK